MVMNDASRRARPGGDARGRWEHFRHQADIGVRGFGPDPAAAFARAATALTAVMVDPETVKPLVKVTVRCQAPDLELLLYDWLNALVYEMSARKMLFSSFAVEIFAHGQFRELRAEVWGETLRTSRHHPAVEVKGATFTELAVRQLADKHWLAQCVVDV